MEQPRFARLDIPADHKLHKRWHGKIVSWDIGYWWSLGGRPCEGQAITVPQECVKPLSVEELTVAQLLEDTFWLRDHYTEDAAILRGMLAAERA